MATPGKNYVYDHEPPNHLYQEATPLVRKLIARPESEDVQQELENVNTAIKQWNLSQSYEENDAVIPVQDLVAELRNYHSVASQDRNTLTESQVQELRQNWKTKLQNLHFPEDWSIGFKYEDLYSPVEQGFQEYLKVIDKDPNREQTLAELVTHVNAQVDEDSRIDIAWFANFCAENRSFATELIKDPGNEDTWKKLEEYRATSLQYLKDHHFWKLEPIEYTPASIQELRRLCVIYYEGLYKENEHHVASLFYNPGDQEAIQALQNLNDKIDIPEYQIPLPEWLLIFRKVMDLVENIARDDDEACTKFNELRAAMAAKIADSPFPKNWGYMNIESFKKEAKAMFPQAGASQAGASQAGASQAGASQAGASQAGASQAGASQAGAPKPPPKIVLNGQALPNPTREPGQPGLHRILGHVNSKTFAVHRPDEVNQLAVVSRYHLDDSVVDRYEKLDVAQKHDLRSDANTYTPADRRGFEKIVGFDCIPPKSEEKYPTGWVLGLWANKKLKVMNRTGWRRIFTATKHEADKMIEDFIISIGQENKFSKRVPKDDEKPPRGQSRSSSRSSSRSYTPESPRLSSATPDPPYQGYTPPPDPRYPDPRYPDPRYPDPRYPDPRYPYTPPPKPWVAPPPDLRLTPPPEPRPAHLTRSRSASVSPGDDTMATIISRLSAMETKQAIVEAKLASMTEREERVEGKLDDITEALKTLMGRTA